MVFLRPENGKSDSHDSSEFYNVMQERIVTSLS